MITEAVTTYLMGSELREAKKMMAEQKRIEKEMAGKTFADTSTMSKLLASIFQY
jgi:hypothetical protein